MKSESRSQVFSSPEYKVVFVVLLAVFTNPGFTQQAPTVSNLTDVGTADQNEQAGEIAQV